MASVAQDSIVTSVRIGGVRPDLGGCGLRQLDAAEALQRSERRARELAEGVAAVEVADPADARSGDPTDPIGYWTDLDPTILVTTSYDPQAPMHPQLGPLECQNPIVASGAVLAHCGAW
jgi:hypothetical protein